jgi:hypothetical protein
MKLRNRTLLRTGAAVAGLVVASSVFAAPAFADTTADLEVRIDGGTIAEGADGKLAGVSVINHGPSAATLVNITFDFSGLIKTKVTIDETYFDVCDVAGDIITCGVTDDGTVASGADLDFGVPLLKVAGATGDAGSITATVSQAGEDNDLGNNTVTAPVVLNGAGADLAVWAPDVFQWDAAAKVFTDKPVPPGGESMFDAEAINFGDMRAVGIKVVLHLPEHVTLTEPEDECVFSADLRTATCEYAKAIMEPFDSTGDVDGFRFPIKVSADAEGPVALTGGDITIAAMSEEKVEQSTLSRKAAPAELPEWVKDVDATDNTDEFSVFVAGDTSGGGGGLPVTGPAATVIGGTGAAILVLGTILFLAARRRRIVTQA